MTADADAIVIGAGPNGLVAANVLADEGWQVVVLEEQPEPGGAVKTAELTVPGFHHDVFSSFYPLGYVSPPLRALELERWGLRWRRAPLVLAHVFADGRAAALSTDLDETAASVDRFSPGDGKAWRDLHAWWSTIGDPLVNALLSPFPPVADGVRLLARLRRPRAVLEVARLALLPVRALTEERFSGAGAAMLLAGNTLHTDLAPESTLGGFFGLLLGMLGQDVGFPVPEGGAGRLTDALVARLRDRGGAVVCGTRVDDVVIAGDRAVGVRTSGGEVLRVRRAILADVVAPTLYLRLVGEDLLPPWLRRGLRGFRYDHPTVKVDWALRSPIPWTSEEARRAGTVHVGDGLDHLTRFAADLSTRTVPARPFVLCGQMAVADPGRAPAGAEVAWAYTHVPHTVAADGAGGITGRWDEREAGEIAERVEAEIEQRAPGFRDLVIARHVMTPRDLEARDANLVNGSLNGGTAHLHQQLVFRPTPGRAGPRTPFEGLFLASASAHPGGAVHGACGANAARAAIRADRRRRLLAPWRGDRARAVGPISQGPGDKSTGR